MSGSLVVTLILALIGVVTSIGRTMWWAARRRGKLRRSGDWGGFVVVDGGRLTPASPPTAGSPAPGLPKGNRWGFLSITPEQIDFRPWLAFPGGSRGFRLRPEQIRRVSHAVEDVRGVFIELEGYDGQMVLFCSQSQGLPEALMRLAPGT